MSFGQLQSLDACVTGCEGIVHVASNIGHVAVVVQCDVEPAHSGAYSTKCFHYAGIHAAPRCVLSNSALLEACSSMRDMRQASTAGIQMSMLRAENSSGGPG